MAFAASLYAVPDLPAPKCKTSVVDLKKAAAATADRETRLKRKIEQANRILDRIDKRQDDIAVLIKELQRRRSALVVDDSKLIPDQYLRETISTSVDKIAIKQSLAKGEDVPGCHLEQKVSLIRK